MPIIQRTKSASNSGQQCDIASTTSAIARTTIASARKDFPPPNETLLWSPSMMKTLGLSAFFTVSSPPCYYWPPSAAGRLPNPLITKEICGPICTFPSAQIRLPKKDVSFASQHTIQHSIHRNTDTHIFMNSIILSVCLRVMRWCGECVLETNASISIRDTMPPA